MADERVSVVIDIDVKDQRQIALLQTQLLALGRQGGATEKAMSGLSGKMGLSNTQMTENSKGVRQLVRNMTLLEKIGSKALKMARVVTYGIIAMGLEFAVTALSLVSVNAAFAIAKFAMQAFNYGMQAVTGGLASLGAAAITAAAAFQEFQAAQYAFNYKDSKTLGNGLEQSADAMRMMMTNSVLAAYGVKSLSSAYATASKNAKVDGKMIKQLEAMADFVSAGPNQDKQLQGAANFLSLIQRGKKANTDFQGELKAAAQEVGPAFSNMFKGNNVGDTGKLLQDLMSGKLAKKGGVAGQAETVAGTIFGKFKTMMTNMYVELGDVGRRMLAPLSDAMDKIFAGLKSTFRRLSGDFVSFGRGSLFPGMTSLAEKTEEFSIKLFRKFLPAASGFFKRTSDAFKAFALEFREVRDSLRPLLTGGSILIKTFGAPIVQIFKSIGENVVHLSDLGVKNKGIYKEFGERLQGIVKAFFNMGRATKEAFVVALPVINKVLDAIATIMNAVAKVLRLLSGLGSFGGAAGIAGMSYLAYKGRRANRNQRVQSGANKGKMIVNPSEFEGSGLVPPSELALDGARPLDEALGVGGRLGGNSAMSALTETADNVKAMGVLGDAARKARDTQSKAVGAAKKIESATKDAVSTKVSRMTINADYVRLNNKGGGPGGKGGRSNVTAEGRHAGLLDENGKRRVPRGPDGEEIKDPKGGLNYGGQKNLLHLTRRNNELVNGYGSVALEQMDKVDQRRSGSYLDKRAASLVRGNPTTLADRDMFMLNPYPGPAPLQGPSLEETTGARLRRFREKKAAIGPEPFIGPPSPTSRFKRVGGFLRDAPSRMQSAVENGITSVIGGAGNTGAQMSARAKEIYYGVPANYDSSSLDGAGVSGRLGGAGTKPGDSPNTGLRARLGRGMFGQSFGTEGFKIRDTFTGGNFKAGMDVERLRALEAGEKPKRGKVLKGGVKNSLSGAGALAGIGTDLFLQSGMGKKLVGDKSAQDSMRTGAAIMAINPLLGLGVGFGGAAMNARTTGGGALAGAASGAAIGAMVGPIGAVVGAGVGALVGTMFAKKNQVKMAKEGVKAIGNSKMFEIATSAIEEGLKTGTTQNARKNLKSFTKFAEDFNATGGTSASSGSTRERLPNGSYRYKMGGTVNAGKKDNPALRQKQLQEFLDNGTLDKTQYDLMTTGHASDETRKKMTDLATNMDKALTPAFDQFDDIMKSLKLSTGMTAEEIVTLATKMNVNLYDPTLKLQDAIVGLGVGMVKTAFQLNQALRDVGVKSLSVFDKFNKKKEMEDSIQSAGNKLRGGDTSMAAYQDYYTKTLDFQNFDNPDDPLGNFIARKNLFANGDMYKKGGNLYGVQRNTEFDALANSALAQEQTGLAAELASGLGAKLTKGGVNFEDAEGGRAMLQGKINDLITKASGGDQDAMKRLTGLDSTIKNSGNVFGTDNNMNAKILQQIFGGATTGPNTKNLGSSYGGFQLGTDKTGQQKEGALTDEQLSIQSGFLDAIKSGFISATAQPSWWDTSPDWWANGLKIENNRIVPGDTSSPRAGAIGDTSVSKTLNRTMGRHNYFDGLVGGKRMVTSSLRDFNLGSPSSDHVTGNAYDLTGQNLGMYSTLINNSGGFAEFHGSAGSRHLHVVPPPGPMGDTSSMRSSGGMTAGSSSTYEGDSFNITVVESANAQSTAQEVVRQISEIQKNYRRRA